MNQIERLLSTGDRRTTGHVADVVELVMAEPARLEQVVNAIRIDNPGLRMRAADALEKISVLHPEWVLPYKKKLLEDYSEIEQKEVRWHLAQILPRLSLTAREREKVFELMISNLTAKSSILKAFSMQALADIALQDDRYREKVRTLIAELTAKGTPAMQSRGRKLLKILG